MYCWICERRVDAFLAYGLPSRRGRCPVCGAKPRGRLLGWLLREVLCPRLRDSARILEAGASRFAVDYLLTPRFLDKRRCTVIDVRRLSHHARIQSPGRFVRMNVSQMGFRAGSFDLILCNNTLPYVSDDRRALAEIRRCLAPDGLAMINTHREPGKTLPVHEHRERFPELGDDYYATNGDKRVYGDDFFDRVAEAGLECRVAGIFAGRPESFLRGNGLKRRNEIILAFRTPDALDGCRHPDVAFGLPASGTRGKSRT